ncbi:hypothetical protein NO113_19820, partial [Clostridioides difficile]|nr:hypothetical protein [Clostridioides difficile]
DLQYVPLDPPFPVRTVALLRRKGAYRTVASTAFTGRVREMLEHGSLASLRTLTTLDQAGPCGVRRRPDDAPAYSPH